MAKRNIFETKTSITPDQEQQSIDVYKGIGEIGGRREFKPPEIDIKEKTWPPEGWKPATPISVTNVRNANGKRK